jgi:replicative DNA helicase
MMLYRPDYYKGEKEEDDAPEQQTNVNIAEVIVAKNRHGETGTVEFAWDGEHTLFLALEKGYND